MVKARPKYFKTAKGIEAIDNWLICWTGQDNNGVHHNVVTNNIPASRLSDFSLGAEGDAQLIANLLNWYYANIEKHKQEINEVETSQELEKYYGK